MKNNKMDNRIKELLQQRAEAYEVSDENWICIKRKINQKEGEKYNMRKFSVKKVVIAAAVAVMLTGTVCLAAGKGVSWVSSSSSRADYTNYQDLSKAEEKAGVTTNAPDVFANGYSFDGIRLKSEKVLDNNNAVVDEYRSVSITYKKDGTRLDLQVKPRVEERAEDDYYTEIIEEDGTKYYYKVLNNKFVPVGYVPTEEEEAQMAAGNLNIGIGASEITEETSYAMVWTYNNQTYQLFTMNACLTSEEMLSMAKEIH